MHTSAYIDWGAVPSNAQPTARRAEAGTSGDGIDDDALTYLTTEDMLHLASQYADARRYRRDARSVDAIALRLGERRRNAEAGRVGTGMATMQRASAAVVDQLRAMMHARARAGHDGTEMPTSGGKAPPSVFS